MQDVGRGDGLDYPTRWLLGVGFSAMPGALFLFLEPTTCPRFAFVRNFVLSRTLCLQWTNGYRLMSAFSSGKVD